MNKLVTLLLLLICQLIQAQGIPSDQLTAANQLFNTQDYLEALDIYHEVLAADSTQNTVLEKAGLSAQRLGDFKLAKQFFHQLESNDAGSEVAIKNLASIYDGEDNIPKAIKYYTKIIDINPKNPLFIRKLAQQYNKSGLLLDAFPLFVQAYTLNSKDNYTVRALSNIFIDNKQFENADSILRQALAYDSLNINNTLLFARSKYSQKQYDSTTFVLKTLAGRLDLDNYFNKMLGYSYLQIDSVDHAIHHLHMSLVNEGNPEYAHYYLATAYEKKDDIDSAIHHFKEAVKAGISKDVDLYHKNLARIYNEKNDLKQAIPHYADAYKYSQDPLVLFFHARAADIYYKDKSIAMNYYKKYEKSEHDNIEYKKYAKDRRRALREQIHLSK